MTKDMILQEENLRRLTSINANENQIYRYTLFSFYNMPVLKSVRWNCIKFIIRDIYSKKVSSLTLGAYCSREGIVVLFSVHFFK